MATHPCKCGFYGDRLELNEDGPQCTCTPTQVNNYRSKLSGPLLDRIDLHIEVPRVPQSILMDRNYQAESSSEIRLRVIKARNIQVARQGKLNSELGNREIERYCRLDPATQELLRKIMNKFGISARGYHRILKVSRTIADLGASPGIEQQHVMTAVQFRGMDRQSV